MRKHNGGFTLVELMVVVTIILALISLLLPSLERVKQSAERARCLANLRGIGQAMFLYTTDHRNAFPEITQWNTLLGKNGHNHYGEASAYDAANPYGHPRPLNIYLGYSDPRGEVPIAECPSDVGDSEPGHPAKGHCYTQYGTSYLAVWGAYDALGNFITWYRARPVYGVRGDSRAPSMRRTSMDPPQTKILLGDWPWHANRLWQYDKTRWHGYSGTHPGKHDPKAGRQLNMLFGDMHAEFFTKVTVEDLEYPYQSAQMPYDRTWKWW
jgi:prepilin-type N-terminal cleavage/methylation domain-containing protein